MLSFTRRSTHEIITVEDTEGANRRVCKCQIKEKHVDGEQVTFPVFECPWLTRNYGFGSENGI